MVHRDDGHDAGHSQRSGLDLQGPEVRLVRRLRKRLIRELQGGQEGVPAPPLPRDRRVGAGIGNTGDFEPGDMALDHAGRWAAGRIAAGVWRPVIYFSIGSWDPIAASLKAAGVSRSDIRIWSAHYTGREHLCTSACQGTFTGTADATQWGSPKPKNTLPPAYASRNVDISKNESSNFWGPPPVAPDFERELKVGSKGHAVEIWQHQMKLRGWHVPLSGTFDPICEGICKTFQKEKGLRVTGRVDTKTWSATWIEPITS